MLAPEPTCENCKYHEEVEYDSYSIICMRFPEPILKPKDSWCWEHPGKSPMYTVKVAEPNNNENIHKFIEDAKYQIRTGEKRDEDSISK